MGYRPHIKDLGDESLSFYGTKLYGYVADELSLPSAQYLVSIGKLDPDDDIWDYGATHEMVLTAEQFRKFIDLYEKDFDEQSEFVPLRAYSDYGTIEQMRISDSDKHIEWG